MGQRASLDLEWEQVQAPGAEIRLMGTHEKLLEGKDGNPDDHAALPMRCACDRAKQGLQWAWGTVGGFDPGSDSDLYWHPDLGRMVVVAVVVVVVVEKEVKAAGGFGHLERLAYQDQSSRVVQKNRKQGKQRWQRWQH